MTRPGADVFPVRQSSEGDSVANHCHSVLREWVLDNREVQVEKNDLRSRSRNESEIKITENQDREVKVK